MANNIKLNNGNMVVTFAEKKGAPVQNYEMYTEGIKALCEIGRVATLKIVEAVTRVSNNCLWKLGNSVKTGLPYNSINEWAIAEFGYSKSHVSEMLSVSKQCCDPETGAPLECLVGYSYTQLLAFTKNPALLLKIKAGEDVDSISLASTAKEIKEWGKQAIEDKQENDSEQSEQSEQSDDSEQPSKPKKSENSESHEERTITIKMADFERWYQLVSEGDNETLLAEWDAVMGNPFN